MEHTHIWSLLRLFFIFPWSKQIFLHVCIYFMYQLKKHLHFHTSKIFHVGIILFFCAVHKTEEPEEETKNENIFRSLGKYEFLIICDKNIMFLLNFGTKMEYMFVSHPFINFDRLNRQKKNIKHTKFMR